MRALEEGGVEVAQEGVVGVGRFEGAFLGAVGGLWVCG